jgi:tetratricopeptide (TPR) repeat protein
MQRTDANLAKLVSEVDRLVTEVAKRPERTVVDGEDSALNGSEYPDIPVFEEPESEPSRWKAPVLILVVLGVLGLGAWLLLTQVGRSGHLGTARSDSASTLSPIEQARVYESKKDYPKAEAIYRELLKKDPDNGEVIRHLASVLFRQDKWDESATILKKLSGGDTNANQ